MKKNIINMLGIIACAIGILLAGNALCYSEAKPAALLTETVGCLSNQPTEGSRPCVPGSHYHQTENDDATPQARLLFRKKRLWMSRQAANFLPTKFNPLFASRQPVFPTGRFAHSRALGQPYAAHAYILFLRQLLI